MSVNRHPGTAAAWTRDFERRCREHGVRLTPQRRAVYRLLAEDAGHPTVDALHGRLRGQWPGLPVATVYRILEDLAAAGLVRRVAVGGGPARFDANTGSHHHLVCRVCGGMEDLEAAGWQALRLDTGGFLVEEAEMRLVGVCARCRKAGAAPGRTS